MDIAIFAQGICIRPFVDSDAAAFAQAVNETHVSLAKWMNWYRPGYSEADALAWFRTCDHARAIGSDYDFGVFSADGGVLYGGIGINSINAEHRIGNVGYWIRESHQRQGIATRAVQAICHYGFEQLGLSRLEIVALVDNTASRALAEKLGAVFECIARNRLVMHGVPLKAAVYSIVPAA